MSQLVKGERIMAFTFIARMKIHPEKRDTFVEACQELEKATLKNEEGCLYYKFYKLRDENSYAVIESFENEELDEAHQQTQHFKDIVPKLMECLDGTYVREFLDPLDS